MTRDPVIDGLIRAMLIREAVASTNLDRDQTISLEEGHPDDDDRSAG